MSNTTNLRLPFLDANQNQKTVTHNQALTILDALVNCQVQSAALTAPPAAPGDGQCWIVASGATGAWVGHDSSVAAWQDGAWAFYPPAPGTLAYNAATSMLTVWNGTAWVAASAASGSASSSNAAQQQVGALGLGTAPDPSNPLSAVLNNALVSALGTGAGGTGDVRVKLNKAAGGNTASFLFQDGFSGCAEIGLTGDDNFHFKVSADGTTFFDALTVAAAGGTASFLAAPTHPSPPAADNSAASATTAWVTAGFVGAAAAAATYATAANATLTGTPTASTQGQGDNSTRLATTAYADRAAAASNVTRRQVGDASAAILPTDRLVAVTSLTAPRTLSLPAASAFPQGATLTVVDESGACSAVNALTLAAAGSDAINGAPAAVIAGPYGYLALASNGSNKWTVVDQPSGTVAGLNGGALAGARNRIVNGNFAINQRAYASGTALPAGTYAHDRWKAGANGATCTFTAAVPDTAVTVTAGTLLQVIEPANVEGGAYTLSWTGTAKARVYQGSASGAYVASPLLVTGLSAGTAVTVEFSAGTLGRVQFEPGPVATPFERRPVGAELALCQRYYQQMGGTIYCKIAFATAFSASSIDCFLYLPVTMRASPTLSFSGSYIATGAQGNITFNASALTPDSVTPNAVSFTAAVSGASGSYVIQTGANGSVFAFAAEL